MREMLQPIIQQTREVVKSALDDMTARQDRGDRLLTLLAARQDESSAVVSLLRESLVQNEQRHADLMEFMQYVRGQSTAGVAGSNGGTSSTTNRDHNE